MAGTLASLLVALGLDSRGYEEGLTRSASKTQRWAADIRSGVGAGLGLGVANAAAMAASAVTDFVGDSIAAASDLNETLSKSSVVFGESARGIERWGKSAADAFGLSQQKAIEAAATFGNLFVGLDIGQDKAAAMSRRLVELAGDLASFNNLDPTEALEKLRSGLAGESEPLRSVGVFLSEAKVKAKAMELGLADAHGELSEGAKVLARYQLILDETTTAQGDFARTSEGLANTQRRVQGRLEDTEAALGKHLQRPALAAQQAFLGLIKTIDSGITTLDLLERQLKGEAIASDDAAQALADFSNPLAFINPGLAELQREINKTGEAMLAASARAAFMSDALKDDAVAVTSFSRINLRAGVNYKTLGDYLDRLDDLKARAKDAFGEVVDAVFGKAIAKGRESQLKLDIDDAKKALKEAEAQARRTGNWRDTLRVDVAKGDLARLRDDLRMTQSDLQALGDKPASDALTGWMDALDKKTLRNAQHLRGLITSYNVLAGLTGGGGGAPGGVANKPRAHGGPVDPYKTYLVGEKGPELFASSARGSIIPLGDPRNLGPMVGTRGMGGGGAGITIVVNIDARSITGMTPAEQEELGRRVGPAVYDYLHGRGAV